MLFISNNTIIENAWTLTADELMPSEGSTHDYVDHKS